MPAFSHLQYQGMSCQSLLDQMEPGGEQPSQELCDANFTQQTQDEQEESIVIGMNENEQQRRQSTADDDHPDGKTMITSPA